VSIAYTDTTPYPALTRPPLPLDHAACAQVLSDAGGGQGVWYGAGCTAPAYESGTPMVLTL